MEKKGGGGGEGGGYRSPVQDSNCPLDLYLPAAAKFPVILDPLCEKRSVVTCIKLKSQLSFTHYTT